MINRRDLIIWSAGFLDGEGYVCIARDVSKHRRWVNFHLTLSASQREREPLDRLKELFGGSIFHYKLLGIVYWRWSLHSKNAAQVLRDTLPYLTVKREVAELAVRFQGQLTQWYEKYGRKGYPDWIVAARETYYQQAKLLNARSKPDKKVPKLVNLGRAPDLVSNLIQ